MPHVIARAPEHQNDLIFWVPQQALAPGLGLFIAENDSAVLARDGRVAGTLGPGSYALDPNYLPFLWNARDASGGIQVSATFVSLAPRSARWSLPSMSAREARTGRGVSLRSFGTLRFRVSDPLALLAAAGHDTGVLCRRLESGEFARRAVQTALEEAFAAGFELAQLAAEPARVGERARVLAQSELAALGVELLDLADLTLQGEAPNDGRAVAPQAAKAEPVYEMLWDCRHCGAKKLLGLTHRHCPNCGAPQNPSERYFPSDDEKVAVQNHVYYGADRICHYCQNANGRNSKHCGTCGGPLEEGRDITRRADQVHATAYAGESAEDARREFAGVAKPQPLPPKKTRWGLIIAGVAGTLLLSLLALVIVAIVWTKPAGLTVTAHEWKRAIEIERFGPVEDTDWCDSVPRGAVVKGRSRAVRSHDKIQKGEKCRTRKVDQGDGTFRESRECEPVYESKPVYDDECRYTINRWSRNRTLTASGRSLAEEPTWPEAKLGQRGECLGCEREGKRTESYTVRFESAEAKDSSSCTFDQSKWQSFKPGSHWVGEVGVIGGVLDCDSLKQP